MCYLFFFQAEDGIRDTSVTGVQTCALPICIALGGEEAGVGDDAAEFAFVGAIFHASGEDDVFFDEDAADVVGPELRSEERRVGKECRCRRSREHWEQKRATTRQLSDESGCI